MQANAVTEADTRRSHHGSPRGLLMFALAWQAGSLVSDPSLWPWASPDAVTAGLLGAVWITMLVSAGALLWSRSFLSRALALNVAISAVTALALLARDNPEIVEEWRAGASLINVTVALVGLWLPARRALLIIGFIVAAEATILIIRGSVGSEIVPWENDVMYPTYALVIGISSTAVREALERVYRQKWHSLDLAQRSRSAADIAASIAQPIRESEVRIHEVVLNTLNAFARGGLNGYSDEVIRRRALEAVSVLEELNQAGPQPNHHVSRPLRIVAADFVETARAEGIGVDVRGEMPATLPVQVRQAFDQAISEALINAIRHSGAANIHVRASSRGGTLNVEIRDDGHGFDLADTEHGFGIPNAIGDGMRAVGARSHIDTSPGEGCVVELEWSMTRAPVSRELLAQERAAVLGPVMSIFFLFAVLSTVVTFPRITSYAGVALALVALAIAAVLLVTRARADRLTWTWAVIITGIAATIFLVQSRSVMSDGSTWGEWGSEAASVLMFGVAAAGPRYAWIVAVAVWLTIQGNVLQELVAPGTIFIGVGALLGEILRKAVLQDSKNLQDQRLAEDDEAVSRLALSRLAARQEVLLHPRTDELLREVGEGTRAWDDLAFSGLWERHERFLRSTLRLDPDTNSLHRFLAEVAVMSWDRSLELDISLGSWEVDMDVPKELHDSALSLIMQCPPGSQVRCAAVEQAPSITLRIVVIASPEDLDFDGRQPGIVMSDSSAGMVMWEVTRMRGEDVWQ